MAREVIVFPDVETLVIQYLNAQYVLLSETARANGVVPNPRPSKFTRVIRTGGVSGLVVDTPTLTVESWADSALNASALAQLNRGLLKAIDQVTYQTVTYQFYRPLEFSGPANLPDPDSSQERYTETFSVGVRGRAL